MRRITALSRFVAGASDAPYSQPGTTDRAGRSRGSSSPSCAVVRLARKPLHDEHPLAGGGPHEMQDDTRHVLIQDEGRAAGARPIINAHTARIAVPGDRPTSRELARGDDFRPLIGTRGISRIRDGITIDGRVMSDHRTQSGPSIALTGPSAFDLGFCLLPIGESVAVSARKDEIASRVFQEYQEIEVAAIAVSSPESPVAGVEDSVGAQHRRCAAWTPIRKASLR